MLESSFCEMCRSPLALGESIPICETCRGGSVATTVGPAVVKPVADNTALFAPGHDTQSFAVGRSTDPLDDARFRKKYQLIELLGRGGMGEVWKAIDRETDRTVAIKFLKPDRESNAARHRFSVEAKSVAQLNHPNVVALYDYSADPDRPYMCLEFVAGTSLSVRLKQITRFEEDEAARHGLAIARGVHAANLAGVIHRDLKPSNVMLGDNGEIKVLDFGLAKRLEFDDQLTPSGEIVGGTPGFLAPEQLDPDRVPDPRMDVWGIGSTIYCLLTGKPPYPTGMAKLTKVLTDDLVSPRSAIPNLHPDLDAIICKCLAKKPEDRYANASEVADELGRRVRREPTLARPRTRLQRFGDRIRRIPKSTKVLTGLVFAAALAAAVLALIPTRTPEERDVADLKAGRTVTLIGETHNEKRLFRTFLEPNSLGKSEVEYSGSGLIAHRFCLCELMGNPGIDRYRFQADLQIRGEKDGHTGESWYGIYFGHTVKNIPNFCPVHQCFAITTLDQDQTNRRADKPQAAFVEFASVILPEANSLEVANGVSVSAEGQAVRYQPSPGTPGKWRSFLVEITPERIAVWWEDPSQLKSPFLDLSREQINQYTKNQRSEVARHRATAEGVFPDWSPRMGLGIICSYVSVGIQNARIQPFK